MDKTYTVHIIGEHRTLFPWLWRRWRRQWLWLYCNTGQHSIYSNGKCIIPTLQYQTICRNL